MCFHKKIDECLLTESLHYIPFWEHLAAWDNAPLRSTDTHSANIQPLLPRTPNGPNILLEMQSYPDQNCSTVTSWNVLKNLAG